MKILFIAYQFPPLNVGGSARPAKFVKYLPQFGITPVVVTLDPVDYSKVYENPKIDLEFSLSDQIEIINIPSKDILRVHSNKLRNFFSIFFNIYRGSEGKYWKNNYFRIIDDYLSKNKIEAIFVTAPPFSILPLAKKTSQKHNLPLIVDMRDPWTMWNMNPYSSYFNYLRAKFTERSIFKQASKIIATSKVTISDFKELHPSIPKEKFAYIPNGYDFEIEFKNIVYEPKENITIGYVGSFYYSPEARENIMTPWWKKKGHRKLQYVPRKEDWLYRSPYYFFKSLEEFFMVHPEKKGKIKAIFAGIKEPWFDDMVKNFNIEFAVEHIGWLSQKESVEFQKSCDFLLITSAKLEGGKDYSVAGKTFEYFALQIPILAFVADGAQKDILLESGCAHCISFNNNSHELFNIFYNRHIYSPNINFIKQFTRVNITTKLCELLLR